MKLVRALRSREVHRPLTLVVLATVSLAVSLTLAARRPAPDRDEPQPIYSADPSDPWNRVFYHLFSRTLRYRVTDEFPGDGPFAEVPFLTFTKGIAVSTRTFERFESGDLGIEPFYPSFLTNDGIREALSETRVFELTRALSDSLTETEKRPPLLRALMQADLWAAYDELARSNREGVRLPPELAAKAAELLPLFARLIRKLALTKEEIEALPDNYAAAATHHQLPDLFTNGSEWVEIEWFSGRMHDRDAHYRRVARVFVKPDRKTSDFQEFLDRMQQKSGYVDDLVSVALVIQNLLIDRKGNILPTRIAYRVQFRTFDRDDGGGILKTHLGHFELSRAHLLEKPESGGLVPHAESDPAFVVASGNDRGYATRLRNSTGENMPILGTVKRRCGACHDSNGARVVTFNMHGPGRPPSPKFFTQPNDIRAQNVVNSKTNQDDFKRLQADWAK